MSKRQNTFKRRDKDFYPTPYEAVLPLRWHLPETFSYSEPCAGNGDLVKHLNAIGGTCSMSSDIEEREYPLDCVSDAFDLTYFPGQYIITNPPWNRPLLHGMIEHFRFIKPTWLLFDSDWFYTKQANDYKPYLEKIVSVGRVKWIPGSKSTGFDNVSWYLFDYTVRDFAKAY